ncbi:hypothetical protein Tco_0235720 [Tanacetum coccineum]
MLNTRNETMILVRPFLETIHAEIDFFNKEISLGIRDDMVTFDMDKKNYNFTTPVGKIYMINSIHNDESPSRSNASSNKTSRESIKRSGLSFLEFLLVKYGEAQEKELIWDIRYAEWCNENWIPDTPTLRFTSVQEDYKPRPKDYPFKDWLLTKVGYTEWMSDLEIDQLVDEYELGIGKKGHMLDDIWENCKKVQGDNTYWWYDQKSEEEERGEIRVDIEGYDPPRVHVETFEIKRYSFDSGQSFICVTKELMDALPLGRENGSRFREMIHKEVDSGRKVLRKA